MIVRSLLYAWIYGGLIGGFAVGAVIYVVRERAERREVAAAARRLADVSGRVRDNELRRTVVHDDVGTTLSITRASGNGAAISSLAEQAQNDG